MRKATIKTKALLVALVALIGFGAWILWPKTTDDVKTVYLDLSVPLYQDEDYDINYENAQALAQDIQKALANDEKIMVTVGKSDLPAQAKQDQYDAADLIISIQCRKAQAKQIIAYLPISNDEKAIKSQYFLDLAADNLKDRDFQGGYYYYLLPAKKDLYHEHITMQKIDDPSAITLPLFDYCQSPVIVLNYYYQETLDQQSMQDLAKQTALTIIEYFSEG